MGNLGFYLPLIGGSTLIIYLVILILFPSVAVIITPIIQAFVSALSAIMKYLWKGFLTASTSTPVMVLILVVGLLTYFYGEHKGAVKTWTKAHDSYTLTPKKYYHKNPVDNLFAHPLDNFDNLFN